MTTAHGALVKLIMREVGKMDDVLIFRRFSGNLWTRDGAMIQSSVPGQCDLWGVMRPNAMHFEIEVKVGKDRMNKNQIAWMETCLRMNIPHHVAHAKSSHRDELELAALETVTWLNPHLRRPS